MVQQHSLESSGFEYVEYYQMVRDLIEEYRLLFIDWVAGFDKWDYIIDRWGLFNPPGVGPFDRILMMTSLFAVLKKIPNKSDI